MSVAPPPPARAAEVFGERLPAAVRYAELLCTLGVERGLVGPREPERIWARHLLNSAALRVLVPDAAEVLDLGSGAGLPGIPLALARPDLTMTLAEPMARRVRFLTECVDLLGLDVRIVRSRAEELGPETAEVVVCRALAPLSRLVEIALPLVRPGGSLVAMKGERAAAELEAALPALRARPDVRVHLDRIGDAEDTVVVVRLVRARRPATAKVGKR